MTTINNTPSITNVDRFADLRYDVKLGTVAYKTEAGVRADTGHVGKVAWRSDNGNAIGLVGPAQTVVQPADTIAVFEHLIEKGYLNPETVKAFTWKGGARTSITAETGKIGTVRDRHGRTQVIKHRIFDYDSFDGSASKRFGDASYVEVCTNGMFGWRNNEQVRLRHTKSINDRFAEAVRALRVQIDGFDAEVAKLRVLAGTRINDAGFKAILEEWFPANDKGERHQRTVNTMKMVERFYHDAPGADDGSLWGAWQAWTYFNTHHRGRADARDERNIGGAGAREGNGVLADLYRRAEQAAAL